MYPWATKKHSNILKVLSWNTEWKIWYIEASLNFLKNYIYSLLNIKQKPHFKLTDSNLKVN